MAFNCICPGSDISVRATSGSIQNFLNTAVADPCTTTSLGSTANYLSVYQGGSPIGNTIACSKSTAHWDNMLAVIDYAANSSACIYHSGNISIDSVISVSTRDVVIISCCGNITINAAITANNIYVAAWQGTITINASLTSTAGNNISLWGNNITVTGTPTISAGANGIILLNKTRPASGTWTGHVVQPKGTCTGTITATLAQIIAQTAITGLTYSLNGTILTVTVAAGQNLQINNGNTANTTRSLEIYAPCDVILPNGLVTGRNTNAAGYYIKIGANGNITCTGATNPGIIDYNISTNTNSQSGIITLASGGNISVTTNSVNNNSSGIVSYGGRRSNNVFVSAAGSVSITTVGTLATGISSYGLNNQSYDVFVLAGDSITVNSSATTANSGATGITSSNDSTAASGDVLVVSGNTLTVNAGATAAYTNSASGIASYGSTTSGNIAVLTKGTASLTAGAGSGNFSTSGVVSYARGNTGTSGRVSIISSDAVSVTSGDETGSNGATGICSYSRSGANTATAAISVISSDNISITSGNVTQASSETGITTTRSNGTASQASVIISTLGSILPNQYAKITGVYINTIANNTPLTNSFYVNYTTVTEKSLKLVTVGTCTRYLACATAVTLTLSSTPSPATVCQGDSITFTATVTGDTAVNYAWYQGTTPLGTTVTNTYAITNAQISDAGSYYVFVTTTNCNATSAPIVVTVNAPSITGPSSQAVCTGATNVTFSVSATGSLPLTYQWQLSTDGGNTWSNISGHPYSGSTTNTLVLSKATASLTGYRYRCIVTDVNGCQSTSNAAILTVYGVGCGGPPLSIGTPGTSTITQFMVNTLPNIDIWQNGVNIKTTPVASHDSLSHWDDVFNVFENSALAGIYYTGDITISQDMSFGTKDVLIMSVYGDIRLNSKINGRNLYFLASKGSVVVGANAVITTPGNVTLFGCGQIKCPGSVTAGANIILNKEITGTCFSAPQIITPESFMPSFCNTGVCGTTEIVLNWTQTWSTPAGTNPDYTFASGKLTVLVQKNLRITNGNTAQAKSIEISTPCDVILENGLVCGNGTYNIKITSGSNIYCKAGPGIITYATSATATPATAGSITLNACKDIIVTASTTQTIGSYSASGIVSYSYANITNAAATATSGSIALFSGRDITLTSTSTATGNSATGIMSYSYANPVTNTYASTATAGTISIMVMRDITTTSGNALGGANTATGIGSFAAGNNNLAAVISSSVTVISLHNINTTSGSTNNSDSATGIISYSSSGQPGTAANTGQSRSGLVSVVAAGTVTTNSGNATFAFTTDDTIARCATGIVSHMYTAASNAAWYAGPVFVIGLLGVYAVSGTINIRCSVTGIISTAHANLAGPVSVISGGDIVTQSGSAIVANPTTKHHAMTGIVSTGGYGNASGSPVIVIAASNVQATSGDVGSTYESITGITSYGKLQTPSASVSVIAGRDINVISGTALIAGSITGVASAYCSQTNSSGDCTALLPNDEVTLSSCGNITLTPLNGSSPQIVGTILATIATDLSFLNAAGTYVATTLIKKCRPTSIINGNCPLVLCGTDQTLSAQASFSCGTQGMQAHEWQIYPSVGTQSFTSSTFDTSILPDNGVYFLSYRTKSIDNVWSCSNCTIVSKYSDCRDYGTILASIVCKDDILKYSQPNLCVTIQADNAPCGKTGFALLCNNGVTSITIDNVIIIDGDQYINIGGSGFVLGPGQNISIPFSCIQCFLGGKVTYE